MTGIILYIIFLLIGYAYSCCAFNGKGIYFRSWMGGIFGNVLLMMGIVPIAFLFGFSYLSHLLLLVLTLIPLCFLVKKRGIKEFKKNLIEKGNDDCGFNNKIFLFLVLPIALLIGVLLTNHILPVHKDGGYASGQCTFGDLQMHLGFVTSIAEQQIFPPNYPFLSGQLMNYPFLVDMLSSSLFLFGTGLRAAVLLPSYVISTLIIMGMYIIAYRLTKRTASAVLATVFFFFCGGFGFSYFLDGAKADPTAFTQIFTEYYHTPTNFTDHNVRWVNSICDMIIPQRTTMAGWSMLFPTLWLLLEAFHTRSRKFYVILGLLAGSMPMIHTHTFLALGMICAVLFFAYLIGEKDKKSYIINWVIYGGIVAAMAAPQLFFWTFRQTTGNESFLRYGFNWINELDPYCWFYLKNWGIVALFAVPAILKSSNKKLLAACAFIFIIAEFILFQPNKYDNNKLFFIVYIILIIFVSDWLLYMWDSLKGIKGRAYLAVIIIAAGTASGILTIMREYKSGAQYQTFSEDDIQIAEYIKENTPSDALFLTSNYHLNPVVSLAGRNIYVGSSLYVYYHGLGDEYYKRKAEIEKAYTGSYENLVNFCEENNISYVYVGQNEINDFHPDTDTLNKLEKIYSCGTETLYKVN